MPDVSARSAHDAHGTVTVADTALVMRSPIDASVGLHLRIYPTGKRSWVWIGYLHGKRHLRTLGDADALPQAAARKLCRELSLEFARAKLALPKAKAALTFREFSREYVERYSRRRNRSWKEDDSRLKRIVLPKLGSSHLGQISRSDIELLHAEISETHPVLANRVGKLLSSMFNRAIEWGYTDVNPAARISYNKEVPRDTFVTEDQAPRFLAAVMALDDIYARTAILLFLLTGRRKNELLSLRWGDVDFASTTLRFTNFKSGRVRRLHLCRWAVELLQALPRKNEWIFPSWGESGHLKDIRKNWTRARNAAGLSGLRIHDLRHTTSSWLAAMGNSISLSQHVMDHADVRTTQRYTHFADPSVAAALDALGQKLSDTRSDAVHEVPPVAVH